MATASTFYDIVETTGDGKSIDFSQFKGQVVYGVNVACR